MILEKELLSNGSEVLSGIIDVTNKNDLDSFVDSTLTKFGALNICVPNAGAIGGAGFAKRKDYIDSDWDTTWEVNVKGLVNHDSGRTFRTILDCLSKTENNQFSLMPFYYLTLVLYHLHSNHFLLIHLYFVVLCID